MSIWSGPDYNDDEEDMRERTVKDLVTFTGTILRRTDKAVHFATESHGTHWFPESQMDELHESNETGGDRIVVTKWICQQKDIEV